jgi:hypothetical protein
LFSLEQEAGAAPKPVTVDLIGPVEPLRKSQPVRICRVGKQLIGVSAGSQPAMLPMADGVVVETSKRTHEAEVHVFQSDPEEGKRLMIAAAIRACRYWRSIWRDLTMSTWWWPRRPASRPWSG